MNLTYKEWCIGRRLRRFPKESWYRYYGKTGFNKIIRANYFAKGKGGIPIDTQAEDISEEIQPEFITEEDIVEFVLKYWRNPFVRKKKPKWDDFVEH